jgi:ABC-type Fe3+/spermidine/putrescine transport system ATPase subunit
VTKSTAVASRPAESAAPAPAAGEHLVVRDLGKQFASGDWAVVKSDFEVARGEFFGLLGPSGCGKSTTLNLIAGFLEPTQGEVRLSDKLLNGVPPHRRGTAMVFQDYALFPHLSAADNVAFGLKLRRKPSDQIKKRVAELLELVGLAHRHANLPSQLSGGEQQRVALARALAVDPEVVLLDEPLSNLDARLRVSMRRELKRILGEAGVTVVFVTHDQAEAFAICDRVAVMRHGLIEDLGDPPRLYRRPRTEPVAKFVGEGNFFPADVVSGDDGRYRVRIKVGDKSVESDAIGEPGNARKGTVLIRPESVQLGTADSGSELVGQIRRVEFQGAITQYDLDSRGAHVRVQALSAAGRHGVDDRVGLSWREADCVFFAAEGEPREEEES